MLNSSPNIVVSHILKLRKVTTSQKITLHLSLIGLRLTALGREEERDITDLSAAKLNSHLNTSGVTFANHFGICLLPMPQV